MVGSYYGGSEDELLLGAAFDADNSLFICGWTSSSNDTMISSIDGQQPFLNSTQDAFLAKFRPDCLGFPAGNQEQGTPCTDPDPCTIDDVYNATCICEGTIPQAGQIVGNTILGSGISYGFTVFPILPGAVYAWEVPDGWTTSDTSASSITIAPPFNGGLDQLCVSATLGLCTLSTSCISILVEPVGIQEALISGAVSIQPNPNNGRFDLIRAREAVGMMRYEVLDATGRIIGQSGILSGPRTTIALDEASAGVYFLRLRHDGGTEVLRVVVQR